MATSLNLITKANEIQSKLPCPEYMLGKGLLQPANNTNSGPRKIMQGIQKEQAIQLCHAETPILMTGYENRFGEMSSNFVEADSSYMVCTKVYMNPMHYWLIVRDLDRDFIHCFERVSYDYITEIYGYNMDTSLFDSLSPGSMIPKGSVIYKPASFDPALNKCDGLNITTAYMAVGLATEDPIIISESAAKKFASPMFSKVHLIINDNDIPLNLYGDYNYYKSFPDIGEEVKDKLLCAVRRERKDDEALYCQSVQHLKELMPSDATYITEGTVVDINVHCNKPENLDIIYNTQIAYYYKKKLEFCSEFISAVDKELAENPKLKMTYDLSKMYDTAKKILDGNLYIIDKVFNNIVVDIVVKKNAPLEVGDKITDRYGGKGVISKIFPDDAMPAYYRNGELKHVEAIYNSSTMVNRENPGQSFETELIFVGEKIVERIASILQTAHKSEFYDDLEKAVKESEALIYKYYSILSPKQAEDYLSMINSLPKDERMQYLDCVVDSGDIYIVIPPISGELGLDKLEELYKAFPWVEADYLIVPQRDSNGNCRKIHSRRPIITGKKYIYRLKQVSEEKFSAVSLSSTNLRGENTKTKANKQHRVAFPNTPVRIGNMETGNLLEAKGSPGVLTLTMMLLSNSPVYRRDAAQLMLGDPFNPTVKFEKNAVRAVNRSAEIVKVYLKQIGLALDTRIAPNKKISPILVTPIEIMPHLKEESKLIEPFTKLPFYLDYKTMRNLGEEYLKNGKYAQKDILNIVNERGDYISPALENAIDRVVELSKKCDSLNDLVDLLKHEPDKEPKKKWVVYSMPIEIMPGGLPCQDKSTKF